ncbi:MAG: thiolase family protein [Nitrososphaerota archaeon]|nr:thiolase family protein [Nitrososphaerota archaeon]
MSDAKVAILSAVRTPIGKFLGGLSQVSPVVLGQIAVEEALRRAKVSPSDIEEILFGCGIQAGLGQNPARQVGLAAGMGVEPGAVTINMVCGSGMKSLMLGADSIRLGERKVVLVGGMESMSRAPYLAPGVRLGSRYGDTPLVDAVLQDSLLDAYDHLHMGRTGEDVARRFGITRDDADAFALRSNQRAAAATERGELLREIAPVPATVTKGNEVSKDEGFRPDTTREKLSRLKPAFAPDGVLTAGNSSQLSDGAAALVLASRDWAEQHGIAPIGWVHSAHTSGVPPSRVMESPIPTVQGHLKKVGLTIGDLDLVEHNEAFSTASIAVQRALNIPDDRFNVNGGAVALGHPIGCSGARIVVTLLNAMAHRTSQRGLATLCMGGGNGLSVLIERP